MTRGLTAAASAGLAVAVARRKSAPEATSGVASLVEPAGATRSGLMRPKRRGW